MAYGQNHQQVASDTFDSSISADWSNGEGSAAELEWISGGHVGPAFDDNSSGMRRSAESYDDDQYSKVTVNASTPNGALSSIEATVRMQVGAESGYLGAATGTDDNSDDGFKIYKIEDGAYTLLDEVIGTLDAELPLTVGETLTLEVEGTTLRLGSDSAGSDVQKVTTTDATWSSGSPGVALFELSGGTGAIARVTAWEGGDIAVAVGRYAHGQILAGVG